MNLIKQHLFIINCSKKSLPASAHPRFCFTQSDCTSKVPSESMVRMTGPTRSSFSRFLCKNSHAHRPILHETNLTPAIKSTFSIVSLCVHFLSTIWVIEFYFRRMCSAAIVGKSGSTRKVCCDVCDGRAMFTHSAGSSPVTHVLRP